MINRGHTHPKEREREMIHILPLLICSVLLFALSAAIFRLSRALYGIDVTTLLFYWVRGTEQLSDYSVVRSIARQCFLAGVVAGACMLLFWISHIIRKTQVHLRIRLFHRKFQINCLHRIPVVVLTLLPIASFFGSVASVCVTVRLPAYIEGMNQESTLYQEQYVSPAEQVITFPEEKQNLIFIVLESMETTFQDAESGGCWNENLIPHLTDLAEENISFGNMQCLTGASFTTGALIAQSAGVVNTNFSADGIVDSGVVLPGAVTLYDILEDQGYQNIFMCGSDAAFGSRNNYFINHGNNRIWDYFTAVEEGKIPENYRDRGSWGVEDQKLYEYAKEVLLDLQEQEQPFCMTFLTVDTHFYDGWICDYCPNTYPTQYENVVACADQLVYEFFLWLEKQPFFENTTVVITGDHVYMDHDFFLSRGISLSQRTIYNCIINPYGGISPTSTDRTFTALDILPTILTALGGKWEGDRLALGVNLFEDTPTLAESMGLSELDRQLSMNSPYYNSLFI